MEMRWDSLSQFAAGLGVQSLVTAEVAAAADVPTPPHSARHRQKYSKLRPFARLVASVKLFQHVTIILSVTFV